LDVIGKERKVVSVACAQDNCVEDLARTILEIGGAAVQANEQRHFLD
jgi:hypothetical protein